MKTAAAFLIVLLFSLGTFAQKRKAAAKPKRTATKLVPPRPVDESGLERALQRESAKRHAFKMRVAPSILKEQHSSVYDIRHFTKFGIQLDSHDPHKSGELIKKVLSMEPSLEFTDNEAAEFVINYSETADKTSMGVFYLKDETIFIVWVEERKTKGAETELTEEFLKVLQRNKKLDDQGRPIADAK